MFLGDVNLYLFVTVFVVTRPGRETDALTAERR
jgi:hypothetical protein